jgi:hypothetical protein
MGDARSIELSSAGDEEASAGDEISKNGRCTGAMQKNVSKNGRCTWAMKKNVSKTWSMHGSDEKKCLEKRSIDASAVARSKKRMGNKVKKRGQKEILLVK